MFRYPVCMPAGNVILPEPGAPKKVRTYKTCVFRIHNPSQRKRAMLDDALRRNHLAYTKALRALMPRLEHYAGLSGRERARVIKTEIARIVLPLPLSSGAKAGVVEDLHSQISSYLELRKIQEHAAPPTVRTLDNSDVAWREAVADLCAAVTREEENARRAHLLAQSKAGVPRPILFLMNRRSNGYQILYNPLKHVYAIWLNLHPKDSRFAGKIQVTDMVDIRTGQTVSFASTTGAIFPVSFGADYQLDRFLRRGTPQSARLLRTGDGHYEVHVTFLFEAFAVQTSTMLGVIRGVHDVASVCVTDSDGRVLAQETIAGTPLHYVQINRSEAAAHIRARRRRSHNRRALLDEAIHSAAKDITELAASHASQVVLEYPAYTTDRGRTRTPGRPEYLLDRSGLAKLERILTYKLRSRGLPPPRSVWAGGASRICARCGSWSQKRREHVQNPDVPFDRERFACVACGHEDDADLNTARNVGQKRMWRDQLPESLRPALAKDIPEEYSFGRFLRHRAVRRGEWP